MCGRRYWSRHKWWRSRTHCCLGCALHASVRALVSSLLLVKRSQCGGLELQPLWQEGRLPLAAVPACHPSIHPSIFSTSIQTFEHGSGVGKTQRATT